MVNKNNMPPKDVSASQLFIEQTTLRPRPHRIVETVLKDESGKPISMIMMVLSSEDSQLCIIDAEKHVRKMFRERGEDIPKAIEKSQGYDDLYNSRSSVELLYKACKKVEDPTKNYFSSVQQISKQLTSDEIACLVKQYVLVQQELGPIISEMDQEEFDAWVEKLAKGGAANFLGLLTLEAQNQFIVSMARQLWNLRMDKSSPTTQLEENI